MVVSKGGDYLEAILGTKVMVYRTTSVTETGTEAETETKSTERGSEAETRVGVCGDKVTGEVSCS